jgi:DNA-binding response OmpR family regulator
MLAKPNRSPPIENRYVATLVVADDDEDLRDVYASALRAAGHDVHEAIDGASALEAIRQHRPSLLLLDLWMPGLTGFDVLERLRHDALGSRLKIVVVSNLGDADSMLEAFEAGATAYLVKGRSLEEMIDLVAQTLRESEGLEALA